VVTGIKYFHKEDEKWENKGKKDTDLFTDEMQIT